MLVGGLLPFSDASAYLTDARVLAEGGPMAGLGANHPIATGMLAVLWRSSQGDYRLILALIALIGAAASWVAMTEVTLWLGGAAGTVFLLVDFLFLRRFIGIPASEHLGVIFGNLGLALGCRAIRTNGGCSWMPAIIATTFALCARAGAILTVPALLCGAYLAWPDKARRRLALPCAMALAAGAAFLLFEISSRLICERQPGSITNAVFVLHSIVYGGTWVDAMNRYGNDNFAVWQAVKMQLRNHPSSVIIGGARSLSTFGREFYLFSFVGRRWLNATLHMVFAAGALAAIVMIRRDKRAWWLVAFLVGLVASIPLLPPWDTDWMRAYAASIPLIGFTAAFGVWAATSALRETAFGLRLFPAAAAQLSFPPSAPIVRLGSGVLENGLLAMTVVLSVLMPPLLRLHNMPSGSNLAKAYAEGDSEATVHYLPEAALRIVSNASSPTILGVRVADFRNGLKAFGDLYPSEAAMLASLPDDCVLLPADQGMSFIAMDASHVPSQGGSRNISMRVHFLSKGWLLLAVDDALLQRGAMIAAYQSPQIGNFSFDIDRYPVIRVGDTVRFAKIITTVLPSVPFPGRSSVNPGDPFILDEHRLRFSLPGEYHLVLNQQYRLRLLVLKRSSTIEESNHLIRDFVTDGSMVESNKGRSPKNYSPAADLERFVESDGPVAMSADSIHEVMKLLQDRAADQSRQ